VNKFSNRSSEIEIMDDLDCSGEVVHRTLHEIEFINKWLGGNTITLHEVKSLLLKNKSPNEIRVADLGCGGGGMLKEIRELCARLGVRARLTGIDANPNIINYAISGNADGPQIEFLCLDIFSEEFRLMQFDIILCTLVAHHFSNKQLSELFKNLKNQATLGVVINDLERNPLAFYSIRFLTSVFSKSAMVKFDAPLSVLRGFKKTELQSILQKAEIDTYNLSWQWAFRWKLVF